ncbi:cytochrome P450 [Paracoccus sp. 11-3]|uniref:Cytochrome P450 n=1 Tax=Paracoccus amoyensis TaxID=2760093 RepID=A0A926GD97_9RHOB|nr:cytochrome P450 [Paracoccus amoyensis]MBC9245264.1 cytochrome P450 [Paracoccus amoyensis]
MSNRAPGPKGDFIWGMLSEFKRDALGLLSRSVAEYGDIVRLRFGPVTAHIVNHPDHIQQVMSRDAVQYDKQTRSARCIHATCGDSLLSGNRQTWQRHRRLIQPVFQPRHLGGLDAITDAQMQPMLSRWQQIAAAGGTIDVVPEMIRLVIAVSAKALFTADVDAGRIEAALSILLDDTWRRLEALIDPSMLSERFHRADFKEARAAIDDIVFAIIQQRRCDKAVPDDLLTLLLSAHEAEGETRLSDQELRDATVTLLLSGHETTANSLSWAMYLLGKFSLDNPAMVDDFFSETLRLYPSIWIVERRAIHPRNIGGYDIPQGSSVLISPYLMHRHPGFWPDADRFDPSRFAEQNGTRPRHAYIPFGLGAHRCVGLYMARAIATRVIANINERFRLIPLPGQQPQIFPGITLRHKVNFQMGVQAI